MFILNWLEYVIAEKLSISDAPSTLVMLLAKAPPVQDSIVDIVFLLLINFLTNFSNIYVTYFNIIPLIFSFNPSVKLFALTLEPTSS